MSRLKIEVNNGVLDLFDNTDKTFYISKQINDLSNLQDRQADFTRQIKIPRTKNNAALLDLLSNERIGNESHSCNMYMDGILVIPSGTLLITSDNRAEVEIYIGAGNFDIFENIPNKSIKDLDFSTYNFAYNQTTLATKNTTTEGVLLSAIQWLDFDSLNNGNEYPSQLRTFDEINNYGFSFHIKTIVNEILIQSGYTFDDSDINTYDHYNDLVLAVPVSVPPIVGSSIFANWSISPAWDYDDGDLGLEVNVRFDTLVSDTDALWDNSNKKYVIDAGGNYKITFHFDIDYLKIANTIPCILRVEKNGSLLTQTQLPNTGNYVGSLFYTDDLLVNDEITATIQAGYKNASQFDVATVNTASYFEVSENVVDPTGNLIVSDWLPDINQRDFLRDFLKIFNALLYANSFEQEVRVIPWQEYTGNTEQDLTNNVDASQLITNEISLHGYYKESLLTYSNDSDITRSNAEATANFGTDESLPQAGTILQLGFSGSEQGKFLVGDVPTPLTSIAAPYFVADWRTESGFSVINTGTADFVFSEDVTIYPGEFIRYGNRIERVRTVNTKTTGTFFNIYGSTLTEVEIEILSFNQVELTPRIGIVDRSQQTNARVLTTNTYGTDADVKTDVDVYDTKFLDMQTIKEDYYDSLFNALQTPKIKTVWMNFNTVEFSQIDMLKPVYIQGFNGSYYINKINQFKLGSPCLVELIRINPLI